MNRHKHTGMQAQQHTHTQLIIIPIITWIYIAPFIVPKVALRMIASGHTLAYTHNLTHTTTDT